MPRHLQPLLPALALLSWMSFTATGQQPELVVQAGHSNIVNYVVFSPNGQLLASCGDDLNIKIWDVKTGRELRTVVTGGAVERLRFSDDGETLYSLESVWDEASGNGDKVRLWDVSNGAERVGKAVKFEAVDPKVAVSHDGKLEAVGTWNAKAVIVTDLVNRKHVWTLTGHTDGVSAVAFSPDDKLLASGSSDTTIKLWDLSSGREVRTLAGYSDSTTAIAVSADLKLIVTGSGVMQGAEEADAITLWGGDSGGLLRTIREKFSGVSALALSPDKRLLAGVSRGSLDLWSVDSGKLLHSLSSISERGDLLVFNRAGTVLLHGGADERNYSDPDGWIKFWNVSTGKLIRELPFPGREILAISPSGRLAAVQADFNDVQANGARAPVIKLVEVNMGGTIRNLSLVARHATEDLLVGAEAASFSADGRVIAVKLSGEESVAVWDVATGRRRGKFQGGLPIAISPGGKTLAAGVPGNNIKLYNVTTGKETATLQGHSNVIASLKFTNDGKILISGGLDTATKLWDVSEGKELLSLISIGRSGWLVVTPSGLFDGSADAMQQVSWRVGNTNEVVPLDAFFNDFYHPGLLAEIVEGGRPEADVSIATQLQLPGLRTMLAEGLARIVQREGKSFLCFSERPTALPQMFSDGQPLALDPQALIYQPDDALCPFLGKELPSGQQFEMMGAADVRRQAAGGGQAKAFKPPYDGVSSATSRSTLHVLAVGVGDYDLAGSALKPLPSSVSGAREVEALFARQVGGGAMPYAGVRVWGGLYDRDATREAIRRRFGEMAGEVRADDVVLIFLSGHGVVPAGQEMFYFAPFDMKGPDPQAQRETGLNVAMLAEAVRAMSARRVVVIIDACQSGGALESLAKIGEVKARAEARRAGAAGGRTTKRSEKGAGVYVITAATPLQEAVQPARGNSALVTTLLKAFEQAGDAAEGQVWIRDVVDYVQRRLPEVSEQMGRRHTPMVFRTGLNFPLLKARPAADGNN